MLEAFVHSELGEIAWNAHRHLGVQLCDSQSEWTPLQRSFLALAADEYGPDDEDIPDPEAVNSSRVGRTRF